MRCQTYIKSSDIRTSSSPIPELKAISGGGAIKWASKRESADSVKIKDPDETVITSFGIVH